MRLTSLSAVGLLTLAGWATLAATSAASERKSPAISLDAPQSVMPSRAWDVRHVDLDVRLDVDAGTLSGVATHYVSPLGVPTGWLRLHQVGLNITEVRVDDRPVLDYRVGHETLDIPLVPGDTERAVTITWSAKPETGLHFRGGRDTSDGFRAAWTQGEGEDNRHWMPLWDYPNDAFTINTNVAVKAPYQAWANGVSVGAPTTTDGWTTTRFQLAQPIVGYLIAIVAGEYRVITDTTTCEGVTGPCTPLPLDYIVPKTWSDALSRSTLRETPGIIRFLEDLLEEPFPYPVYRQAMVSRFLYTGMENATLTTLHDVLGVEPDDRRRGWTDDVVAHEAAHQWFGDLLTCYGWRELWLNEGFATYYTGRWVRSAQGAEAYAVKVHGWNERGRGDPAPMAARSWSKRGDLDNNAVYVRGAAVLHALEVHLGTTIFDAAIRRYVDENKFRLVESEDLRRALEDVSGEHLGWFFDQWVYGQGWPTVTTRWSFNAGQLTLTMQPKANDYAGFHAPVRVTVGLADGSTQTRTLWLGAGQTTAQLALDAPPSYVAFDAEGGVIATFEHQQEPAAWVAQLSTAPHAYAKLEAMRYLGKPEAGEAGIKALRAVLTSAMYHPTFRARAATALGEIATADAIQALVDGARSDEPVVREAVADALGKAARLPSARAGLTALLRDRHPYVAASAVTALAEHDAPTATREARALLSRTDASIDGIVHSQALGVLGRHGVARDLGLVQRFMAPAHPRGVRWAAGMAAQRRLAELDDKPRETARDKLLPDALRMLSDVDLRTREMGVELLAFYGGEAAATALDAYAHTVHDPSDVIKAAKRARATRSKRDDAEPDKAAELKALEARLADYEKRLKRLESWR